jgi:hypothetical protein
MRKIGQRVIYVLQILEREGPSSYPQIAMQINFIDKLCVHTYMRRAVKYGLATVHKGEEFNIYTAKSDWRDAIEIKQPIKPRVKKVQKPMINSVWALGISATMYPRNVQVIDDKVKKRVC